MTIKIAGECDLSRHDGRCLRRALAGIRPYGVGNSDTQRVPWVTEIVKDKEQEQFQELQGVVC